MKVEAKSSKKTIVKAVLVVLMIVATFWFWPTSNVSVPHELVGEWHSTDPNYAGHTFEIDLISVNFGDGNGGVTTGFIKNVSAVSEGNRILYTISYTANNLPGEVSFYYGAATDQVIRFKNQGGVAWTKDPES